MLLKLVGSFPHISPIFIGRVARIWKVISRNGGIPSVQERLQSTPYGWWKKIQGKREGRTRNLKYTHRKINMSPEKGRL